MRKSHKEHSVQTHQIGTQKKQQIVPLGPVTNPKKDTHHEDKKLYQSIVENMFTPIAVVDNTYRILFVNDAACRNFDKPAEKLVGKLCYEQFEKRHSVCPHCPGKKAMETGRYAEAMTEGIRNDDSKFIAHVLAFPSFGQSGEITGFYEIVENISAYEQSKYELEKEKDFAEKLIDTAQVIVLVLDTKGRIVRFNKFMEQLSGYCLDEVKGKDWFKTFLPVKSRQKTRNVFIDAISDNKTQGNIDYIVAKDGRNIPIEWYDTTIKDSQGNITSLLSVGMDITKRKETENAILVSETRYRRLFEAAKDGILILDADTGMVVDVNPFLTRLLGFSREAILEKKVWELGFLRDIVANQASFRELQEKGYVRYEDKPLETSDGRKIDVEFVSNVYLVDHHKVIQCNIRDITERKRAEKALQESQEKLKIILDTVPALIWSKDLNGRFLWINKCYADSIGVKKEETTGNTDFDIFPKEQAEKFRKDDEDVHRTLKPKFGLEEPCKMSDGTTGWVRADKLPFFDKTGNVAGTIGFSIDITERKQAENALLVSETRYRRLFEAAKDGILILDAETGIVVDVNPFLTMLLGFSREDILEKKVWELGFLRDIVANYVSFCELQEKGYVRYEDKPLETSDGRKVDVEFVSNVYLVDHHKVIQCNIRDITERKKAEKAFRESQERFSFIFKMNPAAIAISRISDGRFVDVNKAWEQLTGYTRAEALEHTSTELNLWVEPEQRQHLIEALHKDGPATMEIQGRLKSGRLCELLLSGGIIKLSGEQYIITMAQDITEHKNAEKLLQESQLMLQTVLDTIPVGVFWKDRNLNYLGGNIAWLNMVGLKSSEDCIRKSDYDLSWTKEQADTFRQHDRTIIESGRPEYDIIEPYHQADGKNAWARTNKVPLRDAKGNIIGVMGTNEDITERKITEEKFLEHQEKLKSLASQLTVAEQHERHRIATELHDNIVQKLAVSKIKIDELLFTNQTGPSQKGLKDVHEWLCQALADIRAMAIDLRSPILYEIGFEKAVSVWLKEEIELKHNIITEFYDDGLPKPLNDNSAMLLFRDVRELLYNVVKHSQADKVIVAISRQDSMIKVIVKDNGVGFDITEVTASSPIASLGLFSIKERIEYIGGSFKLDSSVGKGCTATLLAPIKQT